MDMPNAHIREMERLLNLPEDDLFAELGSQTIDRGLGAGPVYGLSMMELGRDWYDRNVDKLRTIICSHQTVIDFLTGHRKLQRVEIAVGILEILHLHFPLANHAVLAALITKEGLALFCKTV